MELGDAASLSEGRQRVTAILNSSTYFGAKVVYASSNSYGYGLANSIQLGFSPGTGSLSVDYNSRCIRDKGLNSTMLGSNLGGNCLVQEGGNKAISMSSGKLLVTGNYRVNAYSITSSSGKLTNTANMYSFANSAISNVERAVLVQRSLAAEECRMLNVPYYANTMYSIRTVNDMELTCN
jgi:hypothetical protein